MDKIQVLIVDSHPVMREALRIAIEIEPDMEVIGEARSSEEAVAQAHALSPDVILMDIFMPDDRGGLNTIDQLLSLDPRNRVVVLSSSTDEVMIEAAFQWGAMGYLTKDAPRPELLSAIRKAARGERYSIQPATQSQFQFVY